MYKNEYNEQDIESLRRKVKTLQNPKTGVYDFKNFGTQGIGHLALALSENYVEATKEYNDPYSDNHYTLQSLESMKDKGGSKLEYDHIIPLQEVWDRAGYGWSEEKKTKFVFDLRVGVVTSSEINNNKKKSSLVNFLNNPVFKGDKRSFCLSWLVIAVEYDIPLTQGEINEIDNKLLKNGSFPAKVINPIKPW
ncbi:MAG: hypothetical protein J6P10_00615 [Aeriscardovia sp.]|nr:hypothetical protein [Aeriscardovia sp.]